MINLLISMLALMALVSSLQVLVSILENVGQQNFNYWLSPGESVLVDFKTTWKAREVSVHQITGPWMSVVYSISKPDRKFEAFEVYNNSINDSPPFPDQPFDFIAEFDIGKMYRSGAATVKVKLDSECKDPVTVTIGDSQVFKIDIGREVTLNAVDLVSMKTLLITFSRKYSLKSIRGTFEVIKKRPYYIFDSTVTKSCDYKRSCVITEPYQYLLAQNFGSEDVARVEFDTQNIDYWSNLNVRHLAIVLAIILASLSWFLFAFLFCSESSRNKASKKINI